MAKRKSYDVRQAILHMVKEKPVSFTKIQTKFSTNYDSVKNNCEELEFYGFVKIKTIQNHPENGKPSHEVELTPSGREIVKKFEKR